MFGSVPTTFDAISNCASLKFCDGKYIDLIGDTQIVHEQPIIVHEKY